MTSKTRLVYLLITTFCLAGCGYKSRNPVSKNGLSSADTIQTAIYEGCGIWDEARPWTWGTSRLWMPVPEAL